MTTMRKVLTFCSLFLAVGFAQETAVANNPADSAAAPTPANDDWGSSTIDDWDTPPTDSSAVQAQAAPDSASPAAAPVVVAKPADTAKVAETAPDSLKVDSTAVDTVAPKKPRNKITYEEYKNRIMRNAKKRSRTLHHGISFVSADYHDKNYWHTDHDANCGMGMGMYYFYRRYFGRYLGFQGRLGALYRYSRWTFDVDEQEGKLSTGEEYTLVHNLDRKYYNFSADMPLTGKFGYHIKGTTTYLFTSLTFGLTKPIYEMTDTENRLYLKSADKNLNADLALINKAGDGAFPVYESHQTNKFFYMDDWETSGWIGLGIESRLVSFEVQMFALGGASQNANHRYYHIGHDSHPTWRMFLDFSIR